MTKAFASDPDVKETMYLSAKRAAVAEIERQTFSVREAPMVRPLLDALPEIVAILNAERQIIFANQALADYLNLGDLAQLYGLRVGEAFECTHAFETGGGCGTTEFCRQCGVANSTHLAQTRGAEIRECHILRADGGALDFRVAASPLMIGGDRYTVFSVSDISSENRRRALERIFFHDVLNTATGVSGAAELLGKVEIEQRREMGEMVRRLSRRLINEIQAQRELAAAESGDLVPRSEPCDPQELVKEIAALYRSQCTTVERNIEIDLPGQSPTFQTDTTLLGRVLGNMLKNALEASSPGETVKIGYDVKSDAVTFRVSNPGVIPRDIQLQLFQRSFTTKGLGRGLGTYSMKLLGEKYLGGKVGFTSTEEEGTTFYLTLPQPIML